MRYQTSTSSDIKWFSCDIHHNTCNKTLVSCPDHTLSWGKGSGDQLSSTLWFISFKTKSADSARSRKRPIVTRLFPRGRVGSGYEATTRLFPRGRVGSGYEATLALNFWCKSLLQPSLCMQAVPRSQSLRSMRPGSPSSSTWRLATDYPNLMDVLISCE